MVRVLEIMRDRKLPILIRKAVSVCLLLLFTVAVNSQERRIADMIELPAYSNVPGHQFVRHKTYTLSYDRKHRLPEWVAWMLEGSNLRLTTYKRSDRFTQDPQIDSKTSPTHDDYTNSGYDRGHMCPAGDNAWSKQAMEESFYTSNICPQKNILNNGTWKQLEEKSRKWAHRYGRIYIVCGPVIPKSAKKQIGKITIPYFFFKAILRIDKDGSYHMIGYLFSQENDFKPVTIDEIEAKTGLDLFHKLPKRIQQKLESRIDLSGWQ